MKWWTDVNGCIEGLFVHCVVIDDWLNVKWWTDVNGYIEGLFVHCVVIVKHQSFLIQFRLMTASELQCTSYIMPLRWMLILHELPLQVQSMCIAQC